MASSQPGAINPLMLLKSPFTMVSFHGNLAGRVQAAPLLQIHLLIGKPPVGHG